jgi:hypothetical protein
VLKIRGHNEIDSVALNIDYIACRDCNKTKEDVTDYLGHPELVLMYNTQSLDTYVFSGEEDFILKESKIFNAHIDKSRANWLKTYFRMN